MSLLRACLGFCCLAYCLDVRAGATDDWVQESEARTEKTFQQCLKDLNEGPLEPLAQDRSREVYRMVYLPSFSPQVSMRADVEANGTGRLIMRRIPSQCDGRSPPVEGKQLALSTADVGALRDAYARADFWRRAKTGGRDGADGIEPVICSHTSSVHFEAVHDGRHHRVSRSCLWVEALEGIKVEFHRLAREKDPHRRT